jgi:hypothetical protein
LTWLIFGLAVWLSVGVVIAQRFNVSPEERRNLDKDEEDATTSAQ